MFEIRNAQGNVVYTATHSDMALGYYYTVRNETGYAEVWHKGNCIFKTR